MECKTYRWTGHHIGDPGTAYRPKKEIEKWKERCPIRRLRLILIQEGILTEKEIGEIESNIKLWSDTAF